MMERVHGVLAGQAGAGGRWRTEEGLSSDEFHDVVWGPE